MASKKDHTWVGNLITDRHIVPRWHPPLDLSHLNERGFSNEKRVWPHRVNRWVALLELEAQKEPTKEKLQSLNETVFVLGGKKQNPQEIPTAVKNRNQTQANKDRASIVDELNDSGEKYGLAGREIANLRIALKTYPNQPNYWSELSRYYTIAGNDEKAARAMQCALHLAPQSIYIRRTASRMYLHQHDPKRALRILRSHSGIKVKPNLLAADIAISSSIGRASPLISTGVNVLQTANFSRNQTSELAAALGSVELEHGKYKKSRAYFKKALLAPNENVVAQAQWAKLNDEMIVIPENAWSLPNIHEARTLKARVEQDWETVMDTSLYWLEDELFSSRPASLASFACFNKGQSGKAVQISSLALKSASSNHALLNNRSVARSYLGETNGAFADIARALDTEEGRSSPYLLATLGLLAYRTNDLSLGELCYGSAIN